MINRGSRRQVHHKLQSDEALNKIQDVEFKCASCDGPAEHRGGFSESTLIDFDSDKIALLLTNLALSMR